MKNSDRFYTLALLGAALLTALPAFAQSMVVTADLQAPAKVRMTPRGNLLVSEGGVAAQQGRISLVTPGGARRTLIGGLPSAKNPEGNFGGPSDVALRGRNLYVLIGSGDVEGAGPRPGTVLPNPNGPSSPIFSSLLVFRFPQDVDDAATGVTMTVAQQQSLSDGETLRWTTDSGQSVEAELVVDFRDTVPDAQTIYRGSNPYALVLRGDQEAYIADASLNIIMRVNTTTGRMSVARRFAPLANPGPIGGPVTDAVPNALYPFGDGYLVASLSGFPFGRGVGRVEYFDPVSRQVFPFINGLTMPVDVIAQDRPGARARFFVLEFSQNFLATPPGPGRLVVYDDPQGRAVVSNLVTPSSMALDPATGDVFVTELGTGRLLRVRIAQ